jgi:hypothetical protein
MRHVKGILFADYVRMIRARKSGDWKRHLRPEDLQYLEVRIEPESWYPMATFERFGNAILMEIASNNLEAVRMWGRISVEPLRQQHAALIAEHDPVETLSRFRVLRSTFFDFDTLDVPLLTEEEAEIVICFHMGMPAEEAASYQTMGFFERLLELSGAESVWASLEQRSWAGDPKTVLDLAWRMRRR